MKIAATIGRYLLGLVFFVFGLNGFLHFLPSPPPPGLAGQFVGAMFVSHYLSVVFALELVSAVLLLVNRYVPLALTILGAIIANILLFHAFLAPSGLPLALGVTVLWFLTAANFRPAFKGLFQQSVAA